MLMHTAIQCTDDRTGFVGSFGFTHGRKTIYGIRYHALTPVFDSIVPLIDYCRDNKIKLLPCGNVVVPILETGTNKLLNSD